MLKPVIQRVLGTRTAASGIEVARLLTDGQRIIALEAAHLRPFRPSERDALRDPARAPDLLDLAHAEAAAALGPADLMGVEGASGALLAQALGWPVVSDFSSADRRLGGLGHPIAAFFFHALARHLGFDAPLAFLVLDRTATMVWCDPRVPRPEDTCLAFDCGPGLPDAGPLGAADAELLDSFAGHEFFRRIPPKTFDPSALPDPGALSPADARATRAAMAAAGIALAFEHLPIPPERLVVTGAGRLDPAFMALIAAGLDLPPEPVEALGLDGIATGAQAVAYLAARVAHGLPTSAPGTTGVPAPVGGGTLDRP